jgi:phosphate/sulfate permease
MGTFYLVLVVVLFALAISDLVVGVSNDAVNFLNSAIGSKAAPKWVIFLMASLGVLIGATFSSGMMEVARKGIFHPDMFYFSEIMVIFLSVMITDVILLDLFNTFGMPTSTTVSVVFELLGAAVSVSCVKIKSSGGAIVTELYKYINSDKALAIITGILVSVFIAFTVGAIVQYLTRLVFTFKYRDKMKYAGAIFGGLAITAITYFMLIKGLGGSSFASVEVGSTGLTLKEWITSNTLEIMIASFIFWTILIQILRWIFKIKILKIVVLAGTFALAMAFAGNDLVNFIGVPLAGFNSFKAWAASGGASPDSFSMEMLAGKVGTPTYMLLVAGLIMISTLIFSRKARSVVATTVDLSRQSEGESERFNSSFAARFLVRSSTQLGKNVSKIVPGSVSRAVESRFQPHSYFNDDDSEAPAFDKVRAAVNLVVASILIAIGTSLKLPLSTTYVTFMVAMGTSLSDRAWDRESAVYRISGVFAVIGGWFLTALIAFLVSGTIALLISVGGKFLIFVFIGVAIFMVLRTQFLFNKKKQNTQEEVILEEKDDTIEIVKKSRKYCLNSILSSNKIFSFGIEAFLKENRNELRESLNMKDEMNETSKKIKRKIFTILSNIPDHVDNGHFYIKIVDYQREISNSLNLLLCPLFEHVENQHKPFNEAQDKEMNNMITQIDEFYNLGLHIVKENKFENIEELEAKKDSITDYLKQIEKNQIKRIKVKDVNTRNSVLFFNINSEVKNMLIHSISLISAYKDLVDYSNK